MSRPELPEAMQELLIDEQIRVMAIIEDKGKVFFSARWPDYRLLFEGIYFGFFADDIEEAVEEYRRRLWRGL